MKKIITVLALTLALTATVLSQTATYNVWFTWTPNPTYDLVTGYRIEYKKIPGVTNWTYLSFVPATTNVTVVTGLQAPYVYSFRSFAVNAVGIGTNLSNIIQIPTNTPSAVSNFSLTTPK